MISRFRVSRPISDLHLIKWRYQCNILSRKTHSEAEYRSSDEHLRSQILQTALLNVRELGWTSDSIAKAIKDLGIQGGPLLHGILDRGGYDLVHHFLDEKRKHVYSTVIANGSSVFEDFQSGQLSIEEAKLSYAIETHFEYMLPYLHTWPSGVAVLADPRYANETFNLALATSDDLCHLSAMQSTRADWYSDRLFALSVYCSSELFLLTDHSANFEDTRAFIRRNIGYQRFIRNGGSMFGAETLKNAILNVFNRGGKF